MFILGWATRLLLKYWQTWCGSGGEQNRHFQRGSFSPAGGLGVLIAVPSLPGVMVSVEITTRSAHLVAAQERAQVVGQPC